MRRSLAALSALALLCTGPVSGRAAPARAGGFWHTEGIRVVNAAGAPVRIEGVTWYGMESSHWVPAGLDFQPYTTIMTVVKRLGYNTIRLPFSNELVERNPVIRDGVRANPQFRGKRALTVMDAIVRYADRIGLKIILDDHRSQAARPMGVNTLSEPLWYTVRYPESAWIRDWQALARRYRDDDAVVGFDLRNEPHTGGSGAQDLRTYLHSSATWGPYNGIENRATDWRLAAERAGNAVLAINPHLLIIVEGIPLYPSRAAPHGMDASWWAGILTPVKRYPVRLSVSHQLVYSVHDWGPRKWNMPWFRNMTDASLQRAWHDHWSFLLDNPLASYAAPLLLGEFGTCTSTPDCIERQRPGNQATWFNALVRFLGRHRAVGWLYFALDGTNSNNCRADNGVLNEGWNAPASRALQTRLVAAGLPTPAMGVATGRLLVPGARPLSRPRNPHSPLCLLP